MRLIFERVEQALNDDIGAFSGEHDKRGPTERLRWFIGQRWQANIDYRLKNLHELLIGWHLATRLPVFAGPVSAARSTEFHESILT